MCAKLQEPPQRLSSYRPEETVDSGLDQCLGCFSVNPTGELGELFKGALWKPGWNLCSWQHRISKSDCVCSGFASCADYLDLCCIVSVKLEGLVYEGT